MSLLEAAEPAARDFTWEPDGGTAGPHSLWGRRFWGWWTDVRMWAFRLFSGCLCWSKGKELLLLHLSVIPAFLWGFSYTLAALGILVPGSWAHLPQSFKSKRNDPRNVCVIRQRLLVPGSKTEGIWETSRHEHY